jgi:hypothetical protein
VELENPSTTTPKIIFKIPINLVQIIPVITELPILVRAYINLINTYWALSILVPCPRMNAKTMWTQNSTDNPIEVTKFTTDTALYCI